MKKLKTVFAIDRITDLATRGINPEASWVIRGEGVATVKVDGTAAKFHDGRLYKRFDRKLTKKYARQAQRLGESFVPTVEMFRALPEGAIPCEDNPDPVTFHHPYWVPATDGPEDAHFREALDNTADLVDGATYELIGPKVQGNIYNLDKHVLVMHGSEKVIVTDRSFEGIKQWLKDNCHEGVVFHHSDGRMAKVRRKDMFDFKIKQGKRKLDWRNENVVFD